MVGSLAAFASDAEEASALIQAIRSTEARVMLTLPLDHYALRTPEFSACLHDSAVHLCPGTQPEEIVMATSPLPTWPCRDSQLTALEAMGRICNLPNP